MSSPRKKAEDLTVADLQTFPVWQFLNDDEHPKGETAVRPVKKLPVKNLEGRLVGSQVHLANGTSAWALLENVVADNPRLTQHFLTLSVFRKGRSFAMARYHDVDSNERGPKALAAFLALPVDAVFPITYDISRVCLGNPEALVGRIEEEPRERLTRDQIIALAVP